MKYRILVIDDSIVNINALYHMLCDSYQVIVAKNKEDGMREARENCVSLVLLNMLIGKGEGFSVLQELKQDMETKQIPVMFIVGKNDEESQEKCLSMGAIDYMNKPFAPSVIKAKVKNYVELYEYRCRMENIASLDGLTGISNRREYEQKKEAFWQEACTENQPLSVAILDIDCFKQYNDRYGHLKGDQVLRSVARKLKECLPKKNAFLGRYGGEEFVVLLRGASEQEAVAVIEQMREQVKGMEIEHLHNRAGKVVTISAGGVTELPEKKSLEELVECADKRLYRAKSNGRNCTIWRDLQEVKGQVEVFQFGRLRLLSGDKTLRPVRKEQSKVWLLLAFLINNRYKNYSKEDVFAAIWQYGEVEDAEYGIRILIENATELLEELPIREAKELIIMQKGVYRWNNTYMCIVDTELFETMYKQAMEESDEEKQYELCERAISLYGGEFLQSVVQVEWVLAIRKRFEHMYMSLLEVFIALCYRKKEYEKILVVSQRALFQDAFLERIQYYYLRSLVVLGRKQRALEHFEYVVEEYYAKLHKDPSEQMKELYLEIIGSERVAGGIDQIESLIREKTIAVGAFYCDMYTFEKFYQIISRNMVRDEKGYCLAVLGISKQQYLERKQITMYMHQLFICLRRALRIGDVFCKVTESEYAVLLPCGTQEDANRIMERILHRFEEEFSDGKAQVETAIKAVKRAETAITKSFHKS